MEILSSPLLQNVIFNAQNSPRVLKYRRVLSCRNWCQCQMLDIEMATLRVLGTSNRTGIPVEHGLGSNSRNVGLRGQGEVVSLP